MPQPHAPGIEMETVTSLRLTRVWINGHYLGAVLAEEVANRHGIKFARHSAVEALTPPNLIGEEA